mmetsp:Transcript_19059/g.35753  ORF Transcript_19059/g.35753 Transcript_19059/m.35753 type:complete len:231 (-) Transcript_19059:45-737(-)
MALQEMSTQEQPTPHGMQDADKEHPALSRGTETSRGDRNRSLTESSAISVPDSEYGVSERQLNEAAAASSSKCVARKLSGGPGSDAKDADFGLGDEQIKALHERVDSTSWKEGHPAQANGHSDNEVTSSATQRSAPNPPASVRPALPALYEVSVEKEISAASLRQGIVRDSSRTSSLVRFDSDGLSVAARGAGSAPFETRVRGLACLGRARQCLTAFFGGDEGSGYRPSP